MSREPLVVVSIDELEQRIEAVVRRVFASRTFGDDDWIDADEAAKILRMHRRTVLKLVRHGGLPAHRIGKLYRFRRSELTAWLDEQRTSAGSPVAPASARRRSR